MISIKKHIPNFVTSLNVACGVTGITFAMMGDMQTAFILMLGAALADFLDGFTARLLDVVSPVGKELDSLCDMVSFGVLPSLMLYDTFRVGSPLDYFPLLIAVFSALRLAKFNTDPRQGMSFIGLATPACAMICATLAYIISNGNSPILGSLCSMKWFIPVLSIILCILLVSEIPMFSMKIKKGASRSTIMMRIIFGIVAISSVAITIIIKANWASAILMTFTGYILMNIIAWPILKKQ